MKSFVIALWLAQIALVVGGVGGWLSNLFAVLALGPIATWGGLAIAKAIGIVVFPLGALLGIIGWF